MIEWTGLDQMLLECEMQKQVVLLPLPSLLEWSVTCLRALASLCCCCSVNVGIFLVTRPECCRAWQGTMSLPIKTSLKFYACMHSCNAQHRGRRETRSLPLNLLANSACTRKRSLYCLLDHSVVQFYYVEFQNHGKNDRNWINFLFRSSDRCSDD